MQIFDTLQKQLTDFTPTSNLVRIHVCGITPYNSAHLGHIFTFQTYDLLQRRLEDLGHTVKLVRNITDVDEPIFKRAAENGEHYVDLAQREIASLQKIMRQLNFREPDNEPLASEYISEMALAVKRLLDSGHAYKLGDDIYFDVKTFPRFGEFSGFSQKLQMAFMADRGGDPERHGKRQPLDFLLWRGVSNPNDPAVWESPVGPGRPGWHIECSVMSSQLLGTPLDLHGGGMDLIFPHHECEIAQSESLGQEPFSTNWMHVAPLLYQGEKMSKSLGNLIFASDLLQNGDAAAIRLAIMNYHYRAGGEWRDEVWQEAKQLARDLRGFLKKDASTKTTGLLETVRAALDNNLDTPSILAAIRTHVQAQGSTDELHQVLHLLGVRL